MKILQKISIIFIIAIIASLTLGTFSTNISMAAKGEKSEQQEASAGSKVTDAMNAVNAGEIDTNTADNITSVANKVVTFLQIASGVFAIIMIAVTGFRYIVETPEMKSELKKSMLPIIVGILLVFFAASIAKFIVNILKPSN